ncbi:hypothetical protein OEA41_008718 [Lepraria neglecta]|uniref:C2H2-type domain-containing protein n=1 Tax=Lepraria neglecta TaxID=209136 RepID=A0AAD9Z178_9LECA|nr:hypothetical protein OEA41_008718 [Lepraria neglecta]
MKCSLPPHAETLAFSTFEEFEIHYAKVHAYRENHDPLEDARRAKEEKTYRCFVEDCDKVCSTPQKRRMHLTDKHMFPKNYDFLIVNTGIDKRSSMLRSRHRRPSSAASRAFHREKRSNGVEENTSIANDSPPADMSKIEPLVAAKTPSPDADVDELASTMSALKFVPPSVRFGRGGRRGGFSRS